MAAAKIVFGNYIGVLPTTPEKYLEIVKELAQKDNHFNGKREEIPGERPVEAIKKTRGLVDLDNSFYPYSKPFINTLHHMHELVQEEGTEEVKNFDRWFTIYWTAELEFPKERPIDKSKLELAAITVKEIETAGKYYDNE